MTYITFTLFVFGVSVVISFMADFFNVDLDRIFNTSNKWLQFLMKPTIYCNVCMSSVWGAIYYFSLLGLESFQEYAIHALISAGLIYLINKL